MRNQQKARFVGQDELGTQSRTVFFGAASASVSSAATLFIVPFRASQLEFSIEF